MATLRRITLLVKRDLQIGVILIDTGGGDFNFGSEDSAWYTSMLAAIPSGLFKIAEGITTLGATLLDLGVDKDRAEAVEDFLC